MLLYTIPGYVTGHQLLGGSIGGLIYSFGVDEVNTKWMLE